MMTSNSTNLLNKTLERSSRHSIASSSLFVLSSFSSSTADHDVPTTREYVVPTDKDVLRGRGGRTNAHPGNQHLLELVRPKEAIYAALKRGQKRQMSLSIVEKFHQWGGRFLEKEMDNRGRELFFVMKLEGAIKVVQQKFRDEPNKRKSKFVSSSKSRSRSSNQRRRSTKLTTTTTTTTSSSSKGKIKNKTSTAAVHQDDKIFDDFELPDSTTGLDSWSTLIQPSDHQASLPNTPVEEEPMFMDAMTSIFDDGVSPIHWVSPAHSLEEEENNKEEKEEDDEEEEDYLDQLLPNDEETEIESSSCSPNNYNYLLSDSTSPCAWASSDLPPGLLLDPALSFSDEHLMELYLNGINDVLDVPA